MKSQVESELRRLASVKITEHVKDNCDSVLVCIFLKAFLFFGPYYKTSRHLIVELERQPLICSVRHFRLSPTFSIIDLYRACARGLLPSKLIEFNANKTYWNQLGIFPVPRCLLLFHSALFGVRKMKAYKIFKNYICFTPSVEIVRSTREFNLPQICVER